MTKWAFTYELDRHFDRFVGPFESCENMVEAVINLANTYWDDDCIHDRIVDAFIDCMSSPDNVVDIFNIKFFKISEEVVDIKTIYDGWTKRLEDQKSDAERKERERQEGIDKQEYERLKKKFGE